MNSRIWHQIRLKLVQIDIQCAIKAQRTGDRAHHLCNKAIQVLVAWSRNIQVAAADIIDGFIVDQERAVGVLDCRVCGEDGVVRFDDCGGNTRSRVHGEFELAFLTVVGGEALKKQRAKARAGSSTEGVEYEEALQRSAVVCVSRIHSQ